jgi:peptidoglycan/LPS O-acetylase OafA/YrhL
MALWPTAPTGFNTIHFWSLAVEEQFYLVWPALIWWVDRRGATRLAVASLVLAPIIRLVFVWSGNIPAAYVLMPARMDALACGAILALIAEQSPDAVRRAPWQWVAVSGAALALFLIWDGTTLPADRAMASVGYTFVALWWTAVLAAVLAGTGLARLSTGAIIRWVGRRSYALYVLHYPILIACRRGASWIHPIEQASHADIGAYALFVVINLALVGLAAEVSWRLLETPALRLKDRFREPNEAGVRALESSGPRPDEPGRRLA